MPFTGLHRRLGQAPGPLTNELLDEAIASQLSETDDLDWKSELPPAKGLTQTDYPKDIAAMANSGGGTIVYGIEEAQKVPTGRRDAGELLEGHERALRSAAVTAITPPVFGLGIHRLGKPGRRAVAIVVPPSLDGPHLIYRGEYFGAPIRNDADTVWMKERQIEAMYRARFDERRHATEALVNLYDESAAGRDTRTRAWIVAVGHSRIPAARGSRLTRDEAQKILLAAEGHALTYARRGGIHPLESIDRLNPRPGLRRWIAPNTATSEKSRWHEAWAAIHDDGSASIAAAIGGHRARDGLVPGDRIESSAIECAIADFMGLIRAANESLGVAEYEVRIGIEWNNESPLTIYSVDQHGFTFDGTSLAIHRFRPVTATINAATDVDAFLQHVNDLAEDCVNQGGIAALRQIKPPTRSS